MSNGNRDRGTLGNRINHGSSGDKEISGSNCRSDSTAFNEYLSWTF